MLDLSLSRVSREFILSEWYWVIELETVKTISWLYELLTCCFVQCMSITTQKIESSYWPLMAEGFEMERGQRTESFYGTLCGWIGKWLMLWMGIKWLDVTVLTMKWCSAAALHVYVLAMYWNFINSIHFSFLIDLHFDEHISFSLFSMSRTWLNIICSRLTIQ